MNFYLYCGVVCIVVSTTIHAIIVVLRLKKMLLTFIDDVEALQKRCTKLERKFLLHENWHKKHTHT